MDRLYGTDRRTENPHFCYAQYNTIQKFVTRAVCQLAELEVQAVTGGTWQG